MATEIILRATVIEIVTKQWRTFSAAQHAQWTAKTLLVAAATAAPNCNIYKTSTQSLISNPPMAGRRHICYTISSTSSVLNFFVLKKLRRSHATNNVHSVDAT